jgi:DNA-binding GntR family transcriptional regulator
MKATTKTQTIIDSIKSAVIGHQLVPGTKLREEHLAEIYGVSRTLIRQALLQLSKERLVTLEPGKVACISQISPREANEVFDARLMVERHVLQRLCSHATASTVATLRAHVVKERAAFKAGNQDEIVRLGSGFHLLLARESGNQLLAEWLDELLNRVALIFVLYRHTYAQHQDCLIDEHAQLIDAIEKKRSSDAVALIEPHLKLVQGSLMSEDSPAEIDTLRQALVGTGRRSSAG